MFLCFFSPKKSFFFQQFHRITDLEESVFGFFLI